jgi:hypothetical protein
MLDDHSIAANRQSLEAGLQPHAAHTSDDDSDG